MHIPKIFQLTPPSLFAMHHSFSEIAPFYDAFILDQFGVLHNGHVALDGAVECVDELKRRDKRLIILSNTSGPAAMAMARLPQYGFDPTHFIGAVTSGEESSKYIRSVYGNDSNKSPSKKAVWLTWDGNGNMPAPLDYLKQCGNVQPARTIEEADFVLCHGAHVWYRSMNDQVSLGSFLSAGKLDVVMPILEECRKRDLPMICANPDFVVRLPDGSTGYMPGTIAQAYSDMGGQQRLSESHILSNLRHV